MELQFLLKLCSVLLSCVLGGYFIGSLPTGYLVGLAKGINICKVGSGNIGATNVLRVLGVKMGILVLLIDLLKGVAACFLALWIVSFFNFAPETLSKYQTVIMLSGGIGAILGHSFTCWLKFRGGKGVATAAGVFLAVAPIATVICILIFAILTRLTRYVSLGSIVAAICLPPLVYVFHPDMTLTILTILCALVVIIRHRTNIQRLLNGTERRIGEKAKLS